MKDKYFLYVGNAYPHKNLEMLLRAATLASVYLVFVGRDDYFYKRLHIRPKAVSDAKLADLYSHAGALVCPSLMEGFGLPALEALSHGCPVIASDIPVFHEILEDVPKYFDPHDEKALVECLKNPPLRSKSFQEKAAKVVQKYSWQKMAKETLSVYENSVCLRQGQ
jgi:glycosyltransferase involved in cell wall biosynthesis